MAKVIKDFFCIKEKKSYKKGEEYKGERTDIDHLLEPKKKVLKPELKNKPASPDAPKPRTIKGAKK